MRVFLIVILLAVTCWAEQIGSPKWDHVTYSTMISSGTWKQPENSCLKVSFGTNKFLACGYDNAGKLMVDDCETIGFAHAWEEKEDMVRGADSLLTDGPGGGVYLGPSYTTKRTRKCRNCKVEEEEYNEITKKWRRK